jgi:hypothetical protein
VKIRKPNNDRNFTVWWVFFEVEEVSMQINLQQEAKYAIPKA